MHPANVRTSGKKKRESQCYRALVVDIIFFLRTSVRLGYEEDNNTLLRSQISDLDILSLFVLESYIGQIAANFDERQSRTAAISCLLR